MWRVIAGSAAYGSPSSCSPDAPLLRRHLRARHLRQKAALQHLFDIAGQQRRFNRAAHQARAFAQNRDRLLFRLRPRLQQLLLGHAAVGPQRQVLPAVDLRALLGQAMRHHAGQRQVHVVAAQQDVLAHRHPAQRKLAIGFRHRNQREIRGAAADIHHQDQVAHRHPLAPVRMPLQPRVEGRLRLFQQRDVLISRLLRRLQSQFPRHRVERRRHRHQHLLLHERGLGHFGCPTPPADAPGSGGWPPRAKSSPPLPARGRAAAATCDPPPNATASSWRRTPAARRSPRRASAPAAPRRNRAPRPTASPGCPPENRSSPADTGMRAADPRRALRRGW